MPTSRRPCRVNQCPHMRPCPLHPEPVYAYQQRAAERPSAAVRGYGAQWQHRRKTFLMVNPFCVECGKPAVHADHSPRSRRELIAAGVSDPDQDQYLEPRCHSCHSRRTAQQDGGFGNKRVGGSKTLEGSV